MAASPGERFRVLEPVSDKVDQIVGHFSSLASEVVSDAELYVVTLHRQEGNERTDEVLLDQATVPQAAWTTM